MRQNLLKSMFFCLLLFAGQYWKGAGFAAQLRVLTNQDVVEMLKVGFSPSVIVDKISSTPCRFDTSVEALARLKAAFAAPCG